MSSNDMSSSNDNAPLEPVRFSRLKLFGKSAAHFREGKEFDSSPTRKGTALHSLLIGDADRVKVYDGKRDKRSKAYQAFLEENPGCEKPLSPREMVDVLGMRRAIEGHERAMQLLDGIREERIEWELAGRACSGTPDVVHVRPNGKILVELKTSVSSAPDLFRYQARKLAYHAQLSWYARGLETALMYTPGPVTEQYIVSVESAPPYPVTIFRVTDALRKTGERQWRAWLEQLLVCERTGNWPGYVESDVEWDEEERELNWDDEEAA